MVGEGMIICVYDISRFFTFIMVIDRTVLGIFNFHFLDTQEFDVALNGTYR